MKKWLIAIGMTVCLLCLTACGQKETVSYLSDSEAKSLAEEALSMVSQVVTSGQQEAVVAQAAASGANGQMYKSAFESYEKAVKDIGSVLGVGEVKNNTMELDVLGSIKEGTIEVEVLGTDHNANLEIVAEYGDITAITTNVDYSFGEKMGKAGLNTLLGMGTVFCVLILISLIISAFNLIPKVQALFAKKPAAASPVEKSVDQTIAQIVENEELSDDLELVAVISAAIAAYEGSGSTDGYVVRSIRRAR